MAPKAFNPDIKPAKEFQRLAGDWLVEIKPTVTFHSGDKRPGIETQDEYGEDLHTRKGDDMWSAVFTVVDDHADAAPGALCFDNLVWNEKGQERIYALLEAMGHDLKNWERGRAIEPEDFYGHPFVCRMAVNEASQFETEGFNPFQPATAKRGPSSRPARKPKAKADAQPVSTGAAAGGEEEGLLF